MGADLTKLGSLSAELCLERSSFGAKTTCCEFTTASSIAVTTFTDELSTTYEVLFKLNTSSPEVLPSGVAGWGEYGLFKLFRAIGENGVIVYLKSGWQLLYINTIYYKRHQFHEITKEMINIFFLLAWTLKKNSLPPLHAAYLYGPTPDECLDLHSLPWAELWRERLNGIGVPWGDIKGVLHSEADPKVAALEISEPEDPKGPLVVVFPWGSICNGKALPLLWRDRNIWTGVLLGEIKGEAKGLWGSEACLGDIGWKLKCLFRVPGLWPVLLLRMPDEPLLLLPLCGCCAWEFWWWFCCCCCCCGWKKKKKIVKIQNTTCTYFKCKHTAVVQKIEKSTD